MAGRAGQSRQLRTRGSSAITAGFGYGLARPFEKRRSGQSAASAASPSRTFPRARASALERESSQERMDPDGEPALHADLPDGPRKRSSGVFESLHLARSASLRRPGGAVPTRRGENPAHSPARPGGGAARAAGSEHSGFGLEAGEVAASRVGLPRGLPLHPSRMQGRAGDCYLVRRPGLGTLAARFFPGRFFRRSRV